MNLDDKTVKDRLNVLRDTLGVDGYELIVEVLDDQRVRAQIIATDDACADCLVPRDIMAAMLTDAVLAGGGGLAEFEVQYPGD